MLVSALYGGCHEWLTSSSSFHSYWYLNGMSVSSLHGGCIIDDGGQTCHLWGYMSGMLEKYQQPAQILPEAKSLGTILDSVAPIKGRDQKPTL